jgi:hypothetical protein
MKEIITVIIFLFLATSCKQDPTDNLVEDPKTPCDFVHNRNVTFKRMIPLKKGKDFDTFMNNKNSKEFKEFLDLFIYYSQTLPEKEKKMKFTDSSYKSCPEWKEMIENSKKVFDKHVSD